MPRRSWTSQAQLDFQKQVLRSTEQQALLDAITAYIGVLRDRAAGHHRQGQPRRAAAPAE
jgi:hypothetical protein